MQEEENALNSIVKTMDMGQGKNEKLMISKVMTNQRNILQNIVHFQTKQKESDLKLEQDTLMSRLKNLETYSQMQNMTQFYPPYPYDSRI